MKRLKCLEYLKALSSGEDMIEIRKDDFDGSTNLHKT